MQITQEQYEKIAKYLPTQRGNVSMTNLQLINAILYGTENNCKWRALPKSYGNWHSVFTPTCDMEQSLLMDRAYEGDNMRAVAMELGYHPVVPPKEEPQGSMGI